MNANTTNSGTTTGDTLPNPGDATQLRHVLGHVPTSVTIVTALSRGLPIGVTVGSFGSVSLDPPLVNFFIDRSSTTWPRLNESSTFTVNVLGMDHAHLCRSFSRRGADRFEGVAWEPSPSGNPVLSEAIAALDCSRYKVDIIGDHIQVVGRVESMQLQNAGLPLVFYRGDFLRLGSGPDSSRQAGEA
ncbi:flavin reductase family protein [Streptomyces sp. NPDC005483]|uniref:flavin reductase family protein n=1 Tax=Streptomyces sp. NPDC005483 TaxID=3154882 RepID=UPI0033BD1DEB